MISQYLFDHYYSHYTGNRTDIIPTAQEIDQAVKNHPEKVVVVKDYRIRGIGIFLTLTDKTYSFLHNIDIKRTDVIQALALENGKNFHFVLLAADSYKTIRLGIKQVMKLKPKTISWFNPDMNQLHSYKVR